MKRKLVSWICSAAIELVKFSLVFKELGWQAFVGG